MKTKSRIIVWKGNCLNTAEFVKVETRKSIAVNGYITGEVEGILFHVSYKLTIDLLWNIKAVFIDFQSDTSFKISLKKIRIINGLMKKVNCYLNLITVQILIFQ